MILRSQRNAVFGAIQNAGLDPALFEWIDEASALLFRQNPAYFFHFEAQFPIRPLRFFYGSLPLVDRVEYFPANADGTYVNIRTASWAEKLNALKVWLGAMINEAQPDLWANLEQRDSFLGGAAPSKVANAPFSEDEQKVIQIQIGEAKRYVRAAHAATLSESQLKIIENQLDYLVEAASRMGRIDWKNALTGALLGLVLNNLVSHETIRDLMAMLSRGLTHLFGLPPVLSLGS